MKKQTSKITKLLAVCWMVAQPLGAFSQTTNSEPDAVVKSDSGSPVAIPAKTYNHLKEMVVLSFPENLHTVKQAAEYFLAPAGYNLVISSSQSRATADILLRQVSSQIRNGQVTTIEKALLLAAGDDVNLVVDHEHKFVTYELRAK
jgi:hypothetical protein